MASEGEIDGEDFQAGELKQVPWGTWVVREGQGDFAEPGVGGDIVPDDQLVLTGEVASC